MTWSDGISDQDACRVLARDDEGGNRDGRGGVARHRLEHDGARAHAGALGLLLDQEAVVVVADDDGLGEPRLAAGSRFSVAARKLEAWSSKKRMNCLGYMARDSGHRRVPEPPERMTGTIALMRTLASRCEAQH